MFSIIPESQKTPDTILYCDPHTQSPEKHWAEDRHFNVYGPKTLGNMHELPSWMGEQSL